ncbi:3-hydroxyacyl-CoA dehydrogenase/enoyl-CoA hydratase family protein [Paenibacillus athensensis]|uniref:3-hydroxyacyl-CoA dehydrogenase n=1 Tax=Paenibacillus athensensis TaxID=1967502 RepID=A0A4Y8QAW2_9BACL|nr:3-hydroxyacyl-CoA dehydrogenase/enoyl-CoA hydratase family protein [Paenibacillus athensensis]
MKNIRTAAVIGSGVMGSGIAAHLANAGVTCLLLDLVPAALTSAEEAAGLTLADPAVRSRLARQAIAGLAKAKPAPLYSDAFTERIVPGNVEDDWHKLSGADWIIEAIVESLPVKRELLARIEQVRAPDAVVSSNTSGVSITAMAEGRSAEFAAAFLGTHFFNPPRYMKLLEIIPGPQTSPELVRDMAAFAAERLGKGVVVARDTPNFIANRIGTFGLLATLREMEASGCSIEEIDAVTGPALGRPKSATFRTLDLVGLDTMVRVADNVYSQTKDPAERAVFAPSPLLARLVERGWLGEKSGQGFYRKTQTRDGTVIEALDSATLTYAPARKVTSPSLEAARQAKGAAARLRALLADRDRYAELAWRLLKPLLLYAAATLEEIADSIVEVDRAMRWGFNWELGPFELWDAIGLRRTVERMESEGDTVPQWVKSWLDGGRESLYERRDGALYAAVEGRQQRLEEDPELISLAALKEQGRVIRSNGGASLIDLGDDVACLEFHSPNNAIGADILAMVQASVDEVRRSYRGLVLANEGRHFCVGANLMLLLMEAQDGEWEEVDAIIRLFQTATTALKGLEKPVVAAPHGMTLGGGVEMCLPADQLVCSAETYLGLVEAGVGLIPAGGGCKELALRASLRLPEPDSDLQPLINAAFETIGMAKVSTSAFDAARLGLLQPHDAVVLRHERRFGAAKQAVLRLEQAAGLATVGAGLPAAAGRWPDAAQTGPRTRAAQPGDAADADSAGGTGGTPRGEATGAGSGTKAASASSTSLPQGALVRVVGAPGKAVLQLGANTLLHGGYISAHDHKIAGKLAHVLAGGDAPAGTLVSEQYLLDLEREAFLSLCGEPLTQQRMLHMLTKGKPLRN